MFFWHIEHPYYISPIVFSTWNMYKFNTDPENGKTYFVDTEKIFNTLSDDDKNFLSSCVIEANISEGQNISKICNVVSNHWFTNNKVIRFIQPENLLKVNGQTPTKNEITRYENIMQYVKNEIYNNTDIRIVHRWNQGDLVILDIYKMCHAVTGGFSSADREFTGLWGYFNNEINDLPYGEKND
jgi:alpha-ketoglutarate-dependent taurine dioxygenase